jgi:transketolase
MRNAFIEAVTSAAAKDPRLVLLTADLGYKLFDDFSRRFPGRFMNVGVAEAGMIGIAAGLALDGWRPVVYSIVPFVTARCLEQIRVDVCSMALPVLVVGVGGGLAYASDGPTHHGVDDIGMLRAIPGMTVVCPCDPRQVTKAMAALIDRTGPVYLRLERQGEPDLSGTDTDFVVGRPAVLRTGHTVALLACGSVMAEVVAAANLLRARGMEPLIVSMHTVKPILGLDELCSVHRISLVVTVEEHGPCGGLFEAVAGHFAGSPVRPRILPVSLPDSFIPVCGSQQALRVGAGLSARHIESLVLRS